MITSLRAMGICGSELPAVCRHSDKSYDHKHCDSEGFMFFICQVTSREYIFVGLCEFMT